MSDSLLETFLRYGTNAQRLAFVPDPPIVSGSAVKVLYEWRETDTGDVYVYDTSWHLISSGTATAITALTGNVTATGPGSVAATIANSAVTLAKIANASASSKLLGSGSSGSGAAYSEITLGSGLSMSSTTLNASGSGGTVTNTGTLTANRIIKGNGSADITVGDLSGDVTTSGTMATTIANSAVTLAKIANAAASSKLVGSGASGSGAAYVELTLGTNLSMSGTTLNASGGGGGGLTWLASYTPSSVASVDITSQISSTYDCYLIIFENLIPVTANDPLNVRFSTNNGVAWVTSNSYYFAASNVTNTGGPSNLNANGATSINIAPQVDTAFEGASGSITLFNPGSALRKTIAYQLDYASSTVFGSVTGGGMNTGTTAIDAIQLIFGTNNVASGKVRFYGYQK